ncbi:HET-domain-containing protein, partial [Pilatotrama ljubarskyi]
MRLLDTFTGLFVEINDPESVHYAILSHTWAPEGEQSFHELLELQAAAGAQAMRNPVGALTQSLSVLHGTCEIARRYGYRYLWIDSCCIDKTSSAELSEAINSMYRWYKLARICFVFLEDVHDNLETRNAEFRSSRWHRRGWTLQELIAPRHVLFFTSSWSVLGSKFALVKTLEEVTGIDTVVLTHSVAVDTISVARRMWWASQRETSRVEDEAYSLMGIFDVHMPTIYGEGRKAFIRLQQEILRAIPDQTLFAW